MQLTLGALTAFAVLAILLVGPAYLAVSTAASKGNGVGLCAGEYSCEVSHPRHPPTY